MPIRLDTVPRKVEQMPNKVNSDLLKDKGHHPDTMFISLERKSELRQIAHGLFPNEPDKLVIDGDEVYVILSPKGHSMNEVLIFSSEDLELKYANEGAPGPLSVTFKNTEVGSDQVIVDCTIKIKITLRDPSAFSRFS